MPDQEDRFLPLHLHPWFAMREALTCLSRIEQYCNREADPGILFGDAKWPKASGHGPVYGNCQRYSGS
ncbi:MAG: hypothetical protein JW705_01125 [Methanosarcinaceae archaeon]|nr:hypothetical protein [Methanosarcinaceae archaeon]